MREVNEGPDPRALDELIAVSRELGSDPTLVLHGGGNTSVKTSWQDVTGRDREVLLVKGSGHDLATIDADGFAPLDLERLRELLPPVRLADDQVRNELRCACLVADAPDPSVETLLHALLPHSAVLHSHADAILTLTNTGDGEQRVRELYGDRVVVVPYEMPGPDLVAACQARWNEASHPGTEALVVLNHGVFAVGSTPRQAIERHRALLALTYDHLREEATLGTPPAAVALPPIGPVELCEFRSRLSELAGRPVVVRRHTDEQVARFVADEGLLAAAGRGPLTPDHVTWIKPFPLVGRDLTAYAAAYRDYFATHRIRRDTRSAMLDPAPRVVLDRALGMLTVGRTAREATIAEDLYRHTMAAITHAEQLGGYRALDPGHAFDLEYWSYQLEKLDRADATAPLAGQVALVTGAASGIGRACAEDLLDAGACVVGWDLAESIETTFSTSAWLGRQMDVTDAAAVSTALQETVQRFGGVDILVVAAGIFPPTATIDELDVATWRRTMQVNVDAVAHLYTEAAPMLQHAPAGGRVVLVASKNVLAPGPGAAAYSSSKAAVTQLSRVAALEWAQHGIRVNMVHPDAVFDTGLWTPELLASRAEHYGLSVDDYKRRNLLRTEVTSRSVARMVRAMVDETFACTTGAQVAVDGGNERTL